MDRPLSKTQKKALKHLLARFSGRSAAQAAEMAAELAHPEIDGEELRASEKKAFLEALPWALRTLLHGTDYQGRVTHLQVEGGRGLAVNNPALAERLKADLGPTGELSRRGFAEMLTLLKDQGTFAVQVDEKGLARTSGVGSDANAKMADMRWITDTVWVTRELLAKTDPAVCPRALFTLARVYVSQKSAFERFVRDPALYHRGGKLDGIAHVFDGATLELDTDMNRRRLESHGLALEAFSDSIKEGLVDRLPSGFPPSSLRGDDLDRVLSSVAYLADYLSAIRFFDPETRTSGNWEEVPFTRSMWDTTAVTLGFESARDLLTNPAYDDDEDIRFVRERLRERSAVLSNPAALRTLVDRGWQAVRADDPCENDRRAIDASAAWTAAFAKLDDDPLRDIDRRLSLLRITTEALLGDHGLRRYRGDSYLATNYEHAGCLDKHGRIWPAARVFEAQDASEEASFAARGALLVPGLEAQWVLPVPVLAIACSRLLNQALELRRASPANAELDALVHRIWREESFFVARTLAAVTPEEYVKSDGRRGQPWALPEAYESITILPGSRFGERYGFVVGANTPLAWTVANAFDAFERFAKDQITMGKGR
jgi:hypothetical protein